MYPTFIGLAQIVIGLLLLFRGSVMAMFGFMVVSGLFGGSASLLLPALGGSSIPPMEFSLPFVVLRILIPTGGQYERLGDALKANWALICFVIYSIVMAIAGPRIFYHQIALPPMRFLAVRSLLDVWPLEPSSQNITTAVYLVGAALVAICSYVALGQRGSAETFVKIGVVVTWIHVFLGVSGAVLENTIWGTILTVFRNGAYAQLNDDYEGYIRITGIFPEASAYAGYATGWFILNFECWYRGVLNWWTGPAAIAMGGVLLASTSSSAYVVLAGFFGVFAIRLFVFPHAWASRKIAVLVGVGFLGFAGVCGFAAVKPNFINFFWKLLMHMTIEKGHSISGIQRTFWAKKGMEAFYVSLGIGVGPGSFRSSSLVTAILGSVGVIGMLLFVIYILQCLKPLRNSTYFPVKHVPSAIGVACSWASIGILIQEAVTNASSNPGSQFALFTGAALVLRRTRLAFFGDRLVPYAEVEKDLLPGPKRPRLPVRVPSIQLPA